MTGAMPIAVYQPAARDERPRDRMARLAGAAEQAAAGGARLLIAPELFTSGYAIGLEQLRARAEPADGPSAGHAREIAARQGLALVYGYPEAAEGVIYNAAACIGPDGAWLANHRKIQRAGPGERERFVAGPPRPTCFELDGHTVAVLICYDVEYPELVRAAALADAGLVAAPTALVERHPFVARHMIPVRAFENGLYVAYANHAGQEGDAVYLGESCIAPPDGGAPVRAGAGEELLLGTVDPARMAEARATLPYLEDLRALPAATR
jgi:predicted amidohydrolase